MPSSLTPDALLTVARSRVASGDWGGVRALLDGREAVALRPELALLLAEAELRLGHPQGARRWLGAAIPRIEQGGDAAALRRAVNLLGAADFELGALSEAEDAFARALELGTREGDDLLVARATNNLGAIANIRGRRSEALALYQLAVPAYQRAGSARGLAESFHNMAITFRDDRQLDQAEEYERRALEFAHEAGDVRVQAMARAGRAELALVRGDARMADLGARLAASDYAKIPDPVGEADALRLGGAARFALGAAADALTALDRAVSLARAHGSALVEAESLAVRARVHNAGGRPNAARADAEAAIAIYRRMQAEEEAAALADWLAEAGAA